MLNFFSVFIEGLEPEKESPNPRRNFYTEPEPHINNAAPKLRCNVVMSELWFIYFSGLYTVQKGRNLNLS
jgi:hypothetical protein